MTVQIEHEWISVRGEHSDKIRFDRLAVRVIRGRSSKVEQIQMLANNVYTVERERRIQMLVRARPVFVLKISNVYRVRILEMRIKNFKYFRFFILHYSHTWTKWKMFWFCVTLHIVNVFVHRPVKSKAAAPGPTHVPGQQGPARN